MAEGNRRIALALAAHDTTLSATVALLEREGFTVPMVSGDRDVTAWIRSVKASLLAYRLTDPATKRTVCRNGLQPVTIMQKLSAHL